MRRTSIWSGKSVIFFALISSSYIFAQQKTVAPPEFVTWLPITPAEQQLKQAKVEPDAGAEVLQWRVHVVDELLGSNRDLQRVFYHYIRLKIFNEKGTEKAATIDLTYGDRLNIIEVAGRTVKPDGSIVELDKKAVYKRDIVRASGRTVKAVSFAMPGVEPGAIVEYRWKEAQDDNRIKYLRLNFQREFPVERVTYFIKPLPDDIIGGMRMYLNPFQCTTSPLKLENDGYNSTYVENVPAQRDEPYTPSEPNLAPWALVHYQEGDRRDPDKYWNDLGKKSYKELKDAARANDEIKSAAATATQSAKNDEEKTAALIEIVRQRVRSVFDDSVTEAEREKFFKSRPKDRLRTAPEILKSGLGTANEMNVVVAALAQQAGLEARPAMVADRNEQLFHPKYTVDDYYLDNIDLAVKVNGAWKVYDVSTRLLPPGMISWREEGVFALITDPKTSTFIQTPQSSPEASTESRTAKLTLTEEGTLEGDVEETYSGHRGEDFRLQIVRKSKAQQDQWLQDRVTRIFPDAKVTMVKLENVDDPVKPLRATYHLEAENFAQVTGKRILFQPNAFRRGQVSPFSASSRRSIIEFPYGWKEVDQVTLQLPMGWKLDNADNPGSFQFGKPGSYTMKMTISKSNELVLNRDLTFGSEGMINFGTESYPSLKKIFDEIQLRDRHTLSMKEN